MIRDDDIIRDLLLRIEAEPKPELMGMPEIEGCSPKVVAYHVGLLKNAGFIDAILVGDMNVELYMALRLTWQGHEFLDTVRDPEI